MDHLISLQSCLHQLSGGFDYITYDRHITVFTSWPDHGVPECGTSILAFHRRIRMEYKPSEGTHCGSLQVNVHAVLHELLVNTVLSYSAGVSRRGTLIAIDIILEQVEIERMLDVSRVVTNMKHQRMKMVQTTMSSYCSHWTII